MKMPGRHAKKPRGASLRYLGDGTGNLGKHAEIVTGNKPMKKIPKISESEWQVMGVLWERSPVTAHDIVKSLSESTLWKPKTIKTLISRLLAKKAIGFEKKGRQYHYFPYFSQADCIRAETQSFLARVYGGGLKPMLAAFIEDEALSEQDVAELKRLLDAKTKD
jgi:BlaI family penicillinase repressor